MPTDRYTRVREYVEANLPDNSTVLPSRRRIIVRIGGLLPALHIPIEERRRPWIELPNNTCSMMGAGVLSGELTALAALGREVERLLGEA